MHHDRAPHLLERSALKAGDTVLIVAATGGVGQFLTQLASQQGLQVIATGMQKDEFCVLRKSGWIAHQIQQSFDAIWKLAGVTTTKLPPRIPAFVSAFSSATKLEVRATPPE